MIGPDEQRRREIDEEITAHLQARIDHLIARGMSPDDARAEALRRFGDLQTGRARLLAQAEREGRRRRLIDRAEALWQDVRYVTRSVSRQPVFALGVILTLTLGLGINAAVFRVADRVLLRPPDGVVRAHELRSLDATTPGVNADLGVTRTSTFSYPQAERAAASGAFSMMTASSPPRLLQDDRGRQVGVVYVDANYFAALGVPPAAGRFFDPAEAAPGAGQRVAVISEAYWRHQLGAPALNPPPSVTLAAETYPVIGVAAPGFSGLDLDPVDVWLPLGVGNFGRGIVNGVVIPWYRSEGSRSVRVTGRLRSDDASGVVASEKIAAALGGGPDIDRRFAATFMLRPIVPVGGAGVSETSQKMLARLSMVSIVVLVIAGANAMHLLLARGTRRQREIATRLALGAGRGRVWRLLMIESVLLAIAAGIVAAITGGWTATLLRQLVFPEGRWSTPLVDVRSLGVTIVLAVLAGIAAGIAPALQATSPNLVNAIKSGAMGTPRRARFTRGALLVAQTALSIVLLVAAGLVTRSLIRISQFNLGFDPQGLVTVSLPTPIFDRGGDSSSAAEELIAQLRSKEPGIEAASASPAPFGAVRIVTLLVPGSKFMPDDRDAPRMMDVSTNYFDVMRTRVTWGRAFTAGDDVGEPVAVVNAAFARNYWGPTLPPGACVLPYGTPCRRVIGIVEDLNDVPGETAPMRFYVPVRSAPTVIVRTRGDEAAPLAARIKAALPATPRPLIEVVSDRIDRTVRPWRMATTLFVVLGAVALVLACVGIYSIMSYGASERVHELGVRVALGATANDVLRLVILGGLRLALAGGIVGLIAAAAGGQLISSLLFDVSPFDPLVYVIAFTGMTAAGVASMLPAAVRAARVDAVVALRE